MVLNKNMIKQLDWDCLKALITNMEFDDRADWVDNDLYGDNKTKKIVLIHSKEVYFQKIQMSIRGMHGKKTMC